MCPFFCVSLTFLVYISADTCPDTSFGLPTFFASHDLVYIQYTFSCKVTIHSLYYIFLLIFFNVNVTNMSEIIDRPILDQEST